MKSLSSETWTTNVPVDAGLAVVVPDHDGLEVAGLAEVDLDPLEHRPELDVIAVLAGLLAVRDEGDLRR